MSLNNKAEYFSLLLGSTFPLSLIRRKVVIEPTDLETVRNELKDRGFVSFWGHRNTMAAASAILGVDVTPKSERPALKLNGEQLPLIDGQVFQECRVLSPEYVPGFRPGVGEEVVSDEITGWKVLKISWV